jgi:hypothetical protein
MGDAYTPTVNNRLACVAQSAMERITNSSRTSRDVRDVPISEVNDSFDHLVGERQQCRGNGNAERFRGFEIDHEGKLARLLDREIAGPGASKEERHLVPSTLIRQNGCPNYIKFRMTLNGIQNRDLSWHTREMRRG